METEADEIADSLVRWYGAVPIGFKEASEWANKLTLLGIVQRANLIEELMQRKRQADHQAKIEYAADPAFGTW